MVLKVKEEIGTIVSGGGNQPVDASRLFADILIEYRESLEAGNRSEKTIVWYMDILNSYSKFLVSHDLMKSINQLGRQELLKYIKYLQDSNKWPNKTNLQGFGKRSPYTIQGHVRAIKAFWGWLTEFSFVDKNSLSKFPLPKVPQKLIKTLSVPQIEKLLSSIDKDTANGFQRYCIFMILWDTGLRISELVGLKMVDLDLFHRMITVIGKGNKERKVPFSLMTKSKIALYIKRYRQYEKSPYLFPKSDDEHISINCVQQYLRRLVNKAGLDGVKCTLHMFRHTCATQLIANGANVFAVKGILGHSSLETTLKYTHLQEDDLRNQHSRFSPVENARRLKHCTLR